MHSRPHDDSLINMMETISFKSMPAKPGHTFDRYDVVIAGSGLVGLALARALALGLGPAARVAIVTRDALSPQQAFTDSRATALSAASVRMLDQLGVWNAARSNAQPVAAIDITDSSLEAGLRPILLSYNNDVGGGEPASVIIPNAHLAAALRDAVLATPQIVVLQGAAVKDYRAQTDSTTVTLEDGHVLTTRLLIAADGARSKLREMAGIKTVNWGHDQIGITTAISHDRPHEGRAVQHFLPGGPFAMLPLIGNRTCITWSEEKQLAQRLLALDDAAFLSEIEQRVGGRLGTLALDGPRQSWPLQTAMARAFIAPRFALVGDAAHNVHPIAGQGLNLGLRDVAALAEVLVDQARLGLDIGATQPLARYERWRRFDTTTSAAGFDALNRMFSTSGALPRAAREFGLGLVNRMPGLKQRLVAEAAGTSGDLPKLLRGQSL
jgi:2-octaprenyl-6-methoxyphenol hydroxylase